MNKNFFEKQMLVDGFNEDSLKKLLNSKVLIIGCGGVGHPAIIYLLSTGIGNLYIADDDLVDFNNLHRQFIFDQNDIGKSKVEIIKSKLAGKYPHSNIISINKRIDEKYLFEIIDDIYKVNDKIHCRFNIQIQKPKGGGNTVIEGKEVYVEENEPMLVLAGLYEHWVSKVEGDRDRLVCTFGHYLPVELAIEKGWYSPK